MSLVLPIAKERYERREEQNFREWVRRNVENAINLAQNATGTGTTAVFTGDSGSGGVEGLVPAPAAGDAAAGAYLDADGTWSVPPTGGTPAWGTITGTLSAQTDLDTALAGKSDISHTHAYSSLTSIPSTFVPSAHTHPWADVTGEPTTLAGYGIVDAAPLVHTHPWADVTGEPTTLAGYGITDAQPLDTDLTALAALSTNGLVARTGTATFTPRTITGTTGEITVTAGDGISGNPTLSLDADIKTRQFQIIIDGGGSAITTGIKGDLYTDINGTITSVVMLADQSGSIVVDIWEDTYTNFPPVVADSITASAKPTISATTKSKDTTLTGWQKTITPDSVLRFNVDSAATVTRVTLSLTVTTT